MTDVLTIADLVLSHADDISNFLIAAALIIAFIIGIAEYKSKLWEYIKNRRNKWWFVYLMVMLAAIVFFKSKSWITGYWLIAVSALWLICGIVCIRSLKPKRFMSYSNPTIKKYEKWLEDGSAIEHMDFFRKSHWYLFTAEDKVEFHMLACTYFADVKEFSEAYKELDKIKDVWLYDEESSIALMHQKGRSESSHTER